jgi:hypothetical protein
MQLSCYPVLLTMKIKYGDDDGPPSSFSRLSRLSPFVATTVLSVSFLWRWLLCCFCVWFCWGMGWFTAFVWVCCLCSLSLYSVVCCRVHACHIFMDSIVLSVVALRSFLHEVVLALSLAPYSIWCRDQQSTTAGLAGCRLLPIAKWSGVQPRLSDAERLLG